VPINQHNLRQFLLTGLGPVSTGQPPCDRVTSWVEQQTHLITSGPAPYSLCDELVFVSKFE
jgi:hypothetical protein